MICCVYWWHAQSHAKAEEESQTAVFALRALSLSPVKVKGSCISLPDFLSHLLPQCIFFSLTVSIYGKGVTLTDNGSGLENVGKNKLNQAEKREPPF